MKQFLQMSFARLKLSVFLMVLILLPKLGWGQIYNYTSAVNGSPASVATNVSGTSLTRVNGAGSTGSPCGTGFTSIGFTNTTTYSSNLPGVNLDLTPNPTYELNITSVSVGLRRSNSGPASARLAYSLDDGTTWIDKGGNDSPKDASCGNVATATWTFSSNIITNSKFKFRIYFFNSGSGTQQILNLLINGAVNLSPPTLSAPTLSGITPYCGGSTVNVSFTTTGVFNAGNNFTAQLSDNNGDFTSPEAIASGTSPISLAIPANLSGTGYKIKVISSDPVIEGQASAVFTIIPALNSTEVSPNSPQTIALNGTGALLTATAAPTSTFNWKFSTNISGPFDQSVSTSQTYELTGADFTSPGTYYLIAEATTTCGTGPASTPIEVVVSAANPLLNIGTISPFSTPANSQSAVQFYTVTGSALSNPVTITPPANFLISQTAGSGYSSSSIILTPVNGVVNSNIYVVYSPAAAGLHSGNIQHTNADINVSPINLAVEGNSVADLSIVGSFNKVTGQIVNTPSAAQTFSINALNLTDNLIISAPANFEVSNINAASGFSNNLTFTPVNGIVSADFWIRYVPTSVGSHSGAVTVVSAIDGLSHSITVEGESISIPIPAAGVLLLEDNFDGTAGGNLTNNGWDILGTPTTPKVTYSANGTGLFYNNYGSPNLGNATILGTGEDISKQFLKNTIGTLYVSALLNVSASATGDYFLCLTEVSSSGTAQTAYKARIFIKKSSTPGFVNFGVSNGNNGEVYSNLNFAENSTHLLVVRCDFNSSSLNTKVYINPNPDYEPLTATIDATDLATISNNIGAVCLRQGGSSSAPTLTIDGLRVGTGWGAVLGNPTYVDATSTINGGNYHNITVNGSATSTVTLNGPVNVHGTLTMNQGKIISTNTNLLTIASTGVVSASEPASYVDGPMAQKVNTAPKKLNFPIGKGANSRPMELNIDSQDPGENMYTAEQFDVAYSPQDTVLPRSVTHISKVRYFKISKSGTANVSANVKLTYAADDFVTDPSKLTIVKYSNGIAEDLTATYNGNTITSGNFSSFSDFMLANLKSGNNPLPVELLSFTAKTAENAIVLTWETASEKNSSHFEIERSVDSRNFETIGLEKAMGNSQNLKRYAFNDKNPLSGLNYYRLKQVDLDGTIAYSKIAQANLRTVKSEITLYPNPTNGILLINLPEAGTGEIQVINVLGQIVKTQQFGSVKNTTLDLQNLADGTYQVQITTNQIHTVKKIIKTAN